MTSDMFTARALYRMMACCLSSFCPYWRAQIL